jgi:molybdopterin-binding protein
MPIFRIKQAANLLGVSADTVRRWAGGGRIETTTDASGRLAVDGVAQVEIQAGPHRFVSLLSREAADELGLEPGMLAVAAVKATNVSVEIPEIS